MSRATSRSTELHPCAETTGEPPEPMRWDDLERQILGFEPLGSRLRPPRTRVPLVHRQALVASLLKDERALVLVCAPAGYGKSIALAQWLAAEPRPGAWLQLDEADNDPVVLLTYLALTLGQVTSLDPDILPLLRLRTPPIEERILPAMCAAVAGAEPFLLVLDDGHLLHSDACWRLVDALLDHLPDGAQCAIGTRIEPPLPFGRLRAADRLAEYGLTDLAMDRRETRELLRLHDRTLASVSLDDLLEVTEGWPAGLRLALLAGQGRPSDEWVPEVSGDQHAIAAYLTEEVIALQPAELQRFLLRTSILDGLSSRLCQVVTGDDHAGEHLATLARENLFVTAMDDRDEWYRYHHLFADLLAALERRREPGELPELHRRAADWHQSQGDIERAVRHWLAAGDVAEAAFPAFVAGFDLVDRGQVESARRLLGSFTDQQLADHSALTMAAGWLYGTVIGDPAKGERWRRAACMLPVGDERWPDGSSVRAYQASLRAFLAPDGVGPMLADAELALSCHPAGGQEASEATRVLGVATYLRGSPRRAERAFRDVLEISDEASSRSYALAFLALIAADEGRWEDAAEPLPGGTRS